MGLEVPRKIFWSIFFSLGREPSSSSKFIYYINRTHFKFKFYFFESAPTKKNVSQSPLLISFILRKLIHYSENLFSCPFLYIFLTLTCSFLFFVFFLTILPGQNEISLMTKEKCVLISSSIFSNPFLNFFRLA